MANLDSSQFRQRGKIEVGREVLVLRHSGVHSLRGIAWYRPTEKYLSATVYIVKEADNNSIILSHSEGVEWPQGGADTRVMKAYLRALLGKVANTVKSKTWPEQKDWVASCNSVQIPNADFRAASCDMSSAAYCTYPR